MNDELKAIIEHIEHGVARLKAHLTPGAVLTPYQEYPKAVTRADGETREVGGEQEETDFLTDPAPTVAAEPAPEGVAPDAEPPSGFAAHVEAEREITEPHDGAPA